MGKRARKFDRRFHESTSRTICRLAFLLLAALPLCACVLFCGVQPTPWYQNYLKEHWQAKLEQALDLPVEIERVELRSPTVSVLHGLHCKHRETGINLCRVANLKLHRYRGQWMIHIDTLEVRDAQMRAAWEHLHDCVLRRPFENSLPITIVADELRIAGHTQRVLRHAQTKLIPDPERDSTWLNIKFLPEYDVETTGDPRLAELTIRRYHDESQLTTNMTISSADLPLPCSLLQPLIPELAWLGANSEFLGTVFLVASREGWLALVKDDPEDNKVVNAIIRNVDFADLTSSLPEPLEGNGRIEVGSASFGAGGLFSLHATVNVQDGWISHQALGRMQRYLGVSILPGLIEHPTPGVHFPQGYVKFSLDQSGFRLAGYEPSLGTILGGRDNQALAWRALEASEQTLPIANLAATLMRSDSAMGWGTVAPAAGRLIRWLPAQQSVLKSARNGLRLSDSK